MKYKAVRDDYGKVTVLMQCDFEDREYFKMVVESGQNRVLCDNKDVTHKYVPKSIKSKKG